MLAGDERELGPKNTARYHCQNQACHEQQRAQLRFYSHRDLRNHELIKSRLSQSAAYGPCLVWYRESIRPEAARTGRYVASSRHDVDAAIDVERFSRQAPRVWCGEIGAGVAHVHDVHQ